MLMILGIMIALGLLGVVCILVDMAITYDKALDGY